MLLGVGDLYNTFHCLEFDYHFLRRTVFHLQSDKSGGRLLLIKANGLWLQNAFFQQ